MITQAIIEEHFEIHRCEHHGDKNKWLYRAVDTEMKQVYEEWFDDTDFPAASSKEDITSEIYRLLKLQERKPEKIYITPTVL